MFGFDCIADSCYASYRYERVVYDLSPLYLSIERVNVGRDHSWFGHGGPSVLFLNRVKGVSQPTLIVTGVSLSDEDVRHQCVVAPEQKASSYG